MDRLKGDSIQRPRLSVSEALGDTGSAAEQVFSAQIAWLSSSKLSFWDHFRLLVLIDCPDLPCSSFPSVEQEGPWGCTAPKSLLARLPLQSLAVTAGALSEPGRPRPWQLHGQLEQALLCLHRAWQEHWNRLLGDLSLPGNTENPPGRVPV